MSDDVSLVVGVSTAASSLITGGGGTGTGVWVRAGGSRTTGLGDGDIREGGGIPMYELSSATGIQLSGG